MLDITKEQAKNLESHANWMENNVDEKKFDMESFYLNEGGYPNHHPCEVNECGSSMCAIGWTVFNEELPKAEDETWNEYSERIFGLDSMSFDEKLFGSQVPNDLKLVTHNMKMVAKLSEIKDKDINDKIVEILLDTNDTDNKYQEVMRKALAKELGVELYKSAA